MSSDDISRHPDAEVALADPPGESAPASPGEGEPDGIHRDRRNLGLLLDVDLQVSVELGRAELKFRDVLDLTAGSVIELGRQAGEPVDILVNGSLLATGEVVVVDERFAVRITRLVDRADRSRRVP